MPLYKYVLIVLLVTPPKKTFKNCKKAFSDKTSNITITTATLNKTDKAIQISHCKIM